MKTSLTLCVAIPLAFASCKKEEIYPEPSLIGKWADDNIHWQFDIKNTTGEGDPVNYLEINNKDGRFLKMSFKKDSLTTEVYSFKILDLQVSQMRVVGPANDTLRFTKFK